MQDNAKSRLTAMVSTQSAEIAFLRTSEPTNAHGRSIGLESQSGLLTQTLQYTEEFRARRAATYKAGSKEVDVWSHGLVSFNGIIAMCLTSELRARIRYRTAIEETCTLLFCKADNDAEVLTFPWQTAKAENEKTAFTAIFRYLKPETLQAVEFDGTSLRALYSMAMVAALFLNLNYEGEIFTQSALYILRFLEERLNAPNALAKEIELLMLIADGSSDSHSNKRRQVAEFTASRLPEMIKDDTLGLLIDRCPIPGCEQPVGWDRIDEAQCLNAHPLGGRCSITFLPILEAGVSKYCSDCHRQYINERVHPETKEVGRDAGDKPCLVRFLLEVFRTCPYCGGKFYTSS